MSWIQDNKVPAAILGLTGAGVVGLGVVLFNAWSAAGSALEEFDSVNTSLANLKSQPLAPTDENLAQKKALVDEYGTSVGKLSKVLYTLQPEDKPITNTDFQAKLKSKVAEVKKVGAGRLPAEFNLGFDQYLSELPKSDAVASELSTYVDAVDEIVRLTLKSGVKAVDLLERSQLASEKGDADRAKQQASRPSATRGGRAGAAAAPAQAPSITERRQVRLTIRTDQAGLQSLLSAFASPSEMPFFTVVRLLRIENEAQLGPVRSTLAAPGESGAADPNAAAPAEGAEGSKPASGVQPAPADSQVVLGRETLRAFLELDLVKFLPPQTASASR